MPGEEAGEGIHAQSPAEKRSPDFRGGGALVPDQAETSSPLDMAEGLAGDVLEEHFIPLAVPESDEKRLAEPLGHGPGGAQQRDALKDQPRTHEFPIMEVGCKEQGGAGSKALEFGRVLGTGNDGRAITTMEKPEQVQGHRQINPDPETKARSEATNPGIVLEGFFFPAYYNK